MGNYNISNIPISVIMCVYNAEEYLDISVKSILEQDFTDYEFIIVNDASTDDTSNILSSFKDKRIKIIENKKNLGLTKSLNRALKLAKGEYIARMDADDISLSNRFSVQYSYLQNHLEIDIVGSQVIHFDNDKEYFFSKPETTQSINTSLFYSNPIMHPSVMIRKSFIINNELSYREKLKYSQDYGLWIDSHLKGRIVNLNKILLHYRISSNNITSSTKHDSGKRHLEIFDLLFDANNIQLTNEEKFNYVQSIYSPNFKIDYHILKIAFSKILSGVYKNEEYNVDILKNIFGYIWLKNIIRKRNIMRIFSVYTYYGIKETFRRFKSDWKLKSRYYKSM
ncbi:glycosyltransferase family 2 protein [Marinilactibacillus sp. GCM10026970]|uniref:glycosyltransferase family 2 protein n=1 Tax=Marinilactibacillus sp. GCM10026970 TaxID=3252642 RepID=UPI003623F47F